MAFEAPQGLARGRREGLGGVYLWAPLGWWPKGPKTNPCLS